MLDMMERPDPGLSSTGSMGLWDSIMNLAQRQQKPGMGGLIGNALGGSVAPGVGYLWDAFGGQPQAPSVATPPFAPVASGGNPMLTQMMQKGQGMNDAAMKALMMLVGLG